MPVPIGFPGRPLVPPGRDNPLAFKFAGGTPAGPSRVQEYSPSLELSAFGSFSGVSPGDTLNAVTLTVSQFASTALMGPPSYELWDDSGTPALLGSGTGTTSTSSGNVDSVTFTNVTYAMLGTLRVRIYAHQGTAITGAIQNVNWVNLTANITPQSNTAILAHGTAAARNAQAAVGVPAVLATAAGTAQSTAFPRGVLASGTGAALGATAQTTAAATAAAALAAGTGTALSPAAAVGVNAAPATEVGAAQNTTAAIAVLAVAATGAGAALNPAVTTAASVTAALASGAGAAQNAAVTTTASTAAVLATGTGTAQGARAAPAAAASLATGTGTALNPAAAVAVNAALATGTGAALNATVSTTTAGTGAAVLAGGTGTARSPAAAIAVPAALAGGTGAAAPVTGPVTSWRIFPSASGPGAPVSYAGNFLCGVIFKVTDGAQWFGGYYKWVAAGGDTTARKFCLWQITAAGSGVLIPAATVTSGTLTAGQWNFVPLTTPVKLAIGTAYNACTGWTCVHGFEDSDTSGAGTGAGDSFGTGGHTTGITTGPLTAYSDQAGGGGTRPEPYGTSQGVFSVAGTDPAAVMPAAGSNSGNFWIDVQVSPVPPPAYAGPYRLWPGKLDTNSLTTTDAPVNYDVATEFALAQSCLLGKIWYYSPPGTAQLATSANVWAITGGGLTGTLAAGTTSPSWSGAAASGWVSCTFTGIVLPPGKYKVSVYNGAATPDAWGAKDANTDYWRAGEGGAGITWGPLSAPNLSAASLAYNFNGNAGGTPPYSDGTTLAAQPTFTQGPPDSYPYLYAAVASPTSGSTQNYWVDVEVTPVIPAGVASGAGAAPSPAAAVGVSAGLATGAGAALNPAAAVTSGVTATAASGTGAALGAVAASAASPAATAATEAGAALNPAAAIGVNAGLATGTGTAQPPAATAAASPAATLATGTGTALNATASTFTAGTANAVLATGTGTAGSATPAAGVNAALASAAGTALGATASTAAFTNAGAVLATGTGTARQPSLTLTSNATATPATGTGTTQATPAIGAPAVAATGTGTARNPGRAAPAGLAAGVGTAAAAALAVAARAAAAQALAAALNATGQGFIPPVYGTAVAGTSAIPRADSGTSTTPAAHAVSGDSQAPYAQQGAYP